MHQYHSKLTYPDLVIILKYEGILPDLLGYIYLNFVRQCVTSSIPVVQQENAECFMRFGFSLLPSAPHMNYTTCPRHCHILPCFFYIYIFSLHTDM